MVESLLTSFGLISKPVKKEQLLKTYKTIITCLKEDLLPSLDNAIAVEKSSKLNKSDIMIATLNVFKVNNIRSKNILGDLKAMFLDIDKNANKIEDLISKHASSVLTSRVLTVKDAAIIKLVDDIGSMVLFTTDFVVCLLADVNNTSFPKIKFKKLKEAIPQFVSIASLYFKDVSKTVQSISKLDDTILNKDSNTNMIDAKIKNSGNALEVSKGFINNPFYHIRMWLVDLDMKKLEKLKDDKKYTEMKLMELEIEKRSGTDNNVTKQIEYYEEKLATIEYEIQKLETV